MAKKLSEAQIEELKRIWGKNGGSETQENDFIKELTYFWNGCPEPIAKGNKKIETEVSRKYALIEKRCNALLKALEEIAPLDRVNILSVREEFWIGNIKKKMPMGDPFDYVQAIQEVAKHQSYELKKLSKHTQQLHKLWSFLDRFPPLKNISRKYLVDLAHNLWPEVDSDSFSKAFRPKEWKK